MLAFGMRRISRGEVGKAGKLKVVFKLGLIQVEYREVDPQARNGKQRHAAFLAELLAQQARTPDATKPALGGLC